MLEKIDFDVEKITKEEYKPVRDELVNRLVVLQQEARSKGIGLVVLFEGWNGAGRGGRISDLMYNLDARATSVHVTQSEETANARMFRDRGYGATDFYPLMKEFWDALDMRGNMTLYDRGCHCREQRGWLPTCPLPPKAQGGKSEGPINQVQGHLLSQ